MKDKPHPLTILLRGHGLTSAKLCEILECSRPTAIRKINTPERLTVEDLVAISKKGGIPISVIREAIR